MNQIHYCDISKSIPVINYTRNPSPSVSNFDIHNGRANTNRCEKCNFHLLFSARCAVISFGDARSVTLNARSVILNGELIKHASTPNPPSFQPRSVQVCTEMDDFKTGRNAVSSSSNIQPKKGTGKKRKQEDPYNALTLARTEV